MIVARLEVGAALDEHRDAQGVEKLLSTHGERAIDDEADIVVGRACSIRYSCSCAKGAARLRDLVGGGDGSF